MRRDHPASEAGPNLAHYIKEYLHHNKQLIANRSMDHYSHGIVQHQRRKEYFESASTRKDRTTSIEGSRIMSRTPAGNISTTSTETRGNSSTHDAEHLRHGTQTKPRLDTAPSSVSSRDS